MVQKLGDIPTKSDGGPETKIGPNTKIRLASPQKAEELFNNAATSKVKLSLPEKEGFESFAVAQQKGFKCYEVVSGPPPSLTQLGADPRNPDAYAANDKETQDKIAGGQSFNTITLNNFCYVGDQLKSGGSGGGGGDGGAPADGSLRGGAPRNNSNPNPA